MYSLDMIKEEDNNICFKLMPVEGSYMNMPEVGGPMQVI